MHSVAARGAIKNAENQMRYLRYLSLYEMNITSQKKRRLSGSPMPEDAPKRLSAASDSSVRHNDASKREAALLLRLSKKEEEIQSLVSELTSLAHAHNPDISSLHRKLLDPAVNALFRAMKKELADRDRIVNSLHEELNAVAFTPNSATGKKLVAKIKALRAENEELGRQLRTGRIEGYEVQMGLGKKMIENMRDALDESDALTASLDTELESLQDRLIELQSRLNRYERIFGPLPPSDVHSRRTPPKEYEGGTMELERRGNSVESERRMSVDEVRSGEELDDDGVSREDE